jgi:hypothetical protein
LPSSQNIGHSLGASAATIAGMQLRDEDDIDVQLVGFGTQALLSEDLIEDTNDFVTTVIWSDVTVANAVIDMLVSTEKSTRGIC